MIDSLTIDKILSASDIVEVVGEYISLKRRGVNYIGNCPFHNEKTPSFTVSKAKGIYKCFGCGKGGNAVNFIMEHDHLGYVEALKILAKKYNIEVVEKEQSPEDLEKKNLTESLLVVSAYAQRYFIDILKKHSEGKTIGLSYFRERGFNDAIINKFELGYSLDERDAFSREAIKQSYKKEYLTATGLSIEREDGSLADRFRGRVIFPIHNLTGKVIAFGGRILKKDDKTAKYLNSPESDIYHKSNVLYGIYFARKAISQYDKCYLTEGYTDVLSMHQSGIENVVASSGTALTIEQIRLIRRFTTNLTIIYDGDAAGIKASLRGIDLVLAEGMNVKTLLLPDGDDPDSFAKKHSSSELLTYIEKNETDFIRFKTNLLLEAAKDDPIKRAELTRDIVGSIAVIPDAIARSVYARECSKLMEVSEDVIISEVNKRLKKEVGQESTENQNYTPQSASVESPLPLITRMTSMEFHEFHISRVLLKYGHVLFRDEHIRNEETAIDEIVKQTIAEFVIEDLCHDQLEPMDEKHHLIFNAYKKAIENKENLGENYFIHHADKEMAEMAASILLSDDKYSIDKIWEKNQDFPTTEDMIVKEMVSELVLSYKLQRLLVELDKLRVSLKESQDAGDMDAVLSKTSQFMQLNSFKMQIAKRLGQRTVIK